MTTFSEVEAVHRKWLYLDHDPDLLRALFATVVGNRYDGPPVWMLVVGPPGSGKTASVIGLTGSDECYGVSSLTPASLGSGSTGSSFLEEIHNKVMVVRDFSTISSMDKASKEQLYGFLRDAYDGEFLRVTGRSNIPVVWRGKFGVIGCTTVPAFDDDMLQNQALGERFLVLRMKRDETHIKAILAAAYKSTQRSTVMKDELQEITRDFLLNFKARSGLNISQEYEEYIEGLADLIARMRAMVSRDRQSREVDLPVYETMEVPTRLVKQLKTLVIGLAALDTNPTVIRRIIARLAADAAPVRRSCVLRMVCHGVAGQNTIARTIGSSPTEVGRKLDELEILGVIKRAGNQAKVVLSLAEEIYKDAHPVYRAVGSDRAAAQVDEGGDDE